MFRVIRRALLIGSAVGAGLLLVGLLPPVAQSVVGWAVLAYLVRGAWAQIRRDFGAVGRRLGGVPRGRHGGFGLSRAGGGDL